MRTKAGMDMVVEAILVLAAAAAGMRWIDQGHYPANRWAAVPQGAANAEQQ
jgi:hypothetical protein